MPLLRFITCPTKKPISLVSPPLKRATSAGMRGQHLVHPAGERALVAHLHQAEPLRDGPGILAGPLGQLGVDPLRGLVAHDALAHERHQRRQRARPRPGIRRSR